MVAAVNASWLARCAIDMVLQGSSALSYAAIWYCRAEAEAMQGDVNVSNGS